MTMTIRPAFKNARLGNPRTAILAGLPVLLLSAAMFGKGVRHDASFAWVAGAAIAGILAVVFLIAAIVQWLYARNVTLFADETTFGKTDIWGRQTVVPLTDLKCVQLSSRPKRVGGQTIQVAAMDFVSLSGATIFRISGEEFSLADIRRMCDEMHTSLVGSWPD